MSVGAVNYPAPVQVNGFACRNCSEVSLASKGIDPQHPQFVPANRDAAKDPSRADADPIKVAAAQRSAEAQSRQTAGYSAHGAVAGQIAPGQIVSALA